MKSNIFFVIFTILFISPVFSISNEFVDVRIATINANTNDIFSRKAKARFTAGTSDNKRLLYGWPNAIWSSFTTIKIDTPGNTIVIYGSNLGTFSQEPFDSFDIAGNTKNTTIWNKNNLEIKQEITIIQNPRDGINKDTFEIKYTIKNNNTFTAYAGMRILLDTQLGDNDNSPIIVKGEGRILKEKKWIGLEIPEAWITYDNIDNPTIKAEGILSLFGATRPDQLIIGQWDYMKEDANLWDYAIHPQDITDTAVAIFYNPVTILAGAEAIFKTYYGIPGISGGNLNITKSVDKAEANRGEILSYNLDYINSGSENISNLVIWDTIPINTSFLDASPGYNTTTAYGLVYWDIPGVISTNTSYSLWFRVVVSDNPGLIVSNTAASAYKDFYWNEKEVKNSNMVWTNIFTATITPTWTITQTHTITPTFTITPTYTNTPVGLDMELIGSFPNPTRNPAKIIVKLTREAELFLKIYNVSGEIVREIKINGVTGYNAVFWDLRNQDFIPVASGVYLYSIEAVVSEKEKIKKYGKMSVIK
ncbi:MAG: T9SS type A sorting domain-containing protein [Candidatus Goldbacteria bacterium]|nr:T9SS type A sorting domain-containing protein [Candidatus Goldiibacteriota bacterium]